MQSSATRNNLHEEATEHGPTLCHIPACFYLHTCTDPWQVAVAGAVQQWQGQEGSGQERPAELSWLLFHKVTCRQTSACTKILHSRKKSLGSSRPNIDLQFSNKSFKWCKTKCGSSSESVIWAWAPAVKRLSDGKRHAVWAEESGSRDFPVSPGKCNFQNHLQPKHHHWAAWELFLKNRVKTSNYAEMHINTSVHLLDCMQTCSCMHIKRAMRKPDDASLVLICSCRKINGVLCVGEKFWEHLIPSFVYFLALIGWLIGSLC